MNNYDYESDYDEDGDVPFVALELDIRDIHTVYKVIAFHYEKWPGGDAYEQERIHALRDFFYRMILEYKFHVE